jgi:4-alpha-glucanotransferase
MIMDKRGSGILLHITSLPSRFGIGDMGPGAYACADVLHSSGQSDWQVLPVNPTQMIHGNSPYSSISAFAGNPLLISPDQMITDGLITEEELGHIPDFPPDRTDYGTVTEYKQKILEKAAGKFQSHSHRRSEYERFISGSGHWLDDFSRFMVLKQKFNGAVWSEWPPDYRDRDPQAIRNTDVEFREQIESIRIQQFIFYSQWTALRRYCNTHGISIIGDIPIYVNYDSPDVWTNPNRFKLNENKKPVAVSGVPPDYFSENGQLWGNPVYNWKAMKKDRFSWWIDRLGHNLFLFDIVRIDHFRGLVAYWEVPAGERTAKNGKWIPVPTENLLDSLKSTFPELPIIAEDLGIITPDVYEIMDRYDLPGMKVLLFAFGDDPWKNPYAPHNHVPNCVVYTGTHDNNTIRGWFDTEATPEDKKRLFQYLGREVPINELNWEMIRILMMSSANTIITPMQDILGLDEEARMNTPSTLTGNWEWKLLPDHLNPSLAKSLREMTEIYGRA